jgi:hypothetical protein
MASLDNVNRHDELVRKIDEELHGLIGASLFRFDARPYERIESVECVNVVDVARLVDAFEDKLQPFTLQRVVDQLEHARHVRSHIVVDARARTRM